jgi:hypothetical protein
MAGFGGIGAAGLGGSSGSGACSLCPCNDMCLSSCFDCGQGCLCQDAQQPAPLPWSPPFDAIGDVGWKDSEDPLCTGLNSNGAASVDVFADSRGVFVAVSGSGMLPALPTGDGGEEDAGVERLPIVLQPNDFGTHTSVWFNDGETWRLRADATNAVGVYRVTGIPSGPVALYNESDVFKQMGFGTPDCNLGLVHDTAIDCFDLDPVQSVLGVDASLTYALSGNNHVLAYDGTTWHSNIAPSPYSASALWADANAVLAVGKAGTAMWYEAGVWTLDDPGTLEGFTSVWGRARDDLWAGTANGGVFHYDGATWSEKGHLGGTTCDTRFPVLDVWGNDDAVYFATQSELARWNGEALESLGNWTCSALQSRVITGIAGLGPKDVFLSMYDNDRNGIDQCGAYFVVRYDGKEFHRM